MTSLTEEERVRLGSLLSRRAVIKLRDARKAEKRNASAHLIEQLYEDSEWCREIAIKLLGSAAVDAEFDAADKPTSTTEIKEALGIRESAPEFCYTDVEDVSGLR